MSNVNKNIAVEAKLISPPTYIVKHNFLLIRSLSFIPSYVFQFVYGAIFRLVFRVVCTYNCWCFESYEISYHK